MQTCAAGLKSSELEDVFKFATVVPGTNQIVIGHHTKRCWFIGAAVAKSVGAGQDYSLGVSLKGTTASVTLNGQNVLGFVFNAAVVDGQAGLFTRTTTSSFDTVRIQTDDPRYRSSK